MDLEPDHPSQRLSNVTFRDCRSFGNTGCGFQAYLNALNGSSAPISIMLSNLSVSSKDFGVALMAMDRVRGTIDVVDSHVFDTAKTGIAVFDKTVRESIVRVRGCRLERTGTRGAGFFPLAVSAQRWATKRHFAVGNVSFDNCDVYDDRDRRFLQAWNPGLADLAVTAKDLRVHNPHGCRSDLNLTVRCTAKTDDGQDILPPPASTVVYRSGECDRSGLCYGEIRIPALVGPTVSGRLLAFGEARYPSTGVPRYPAPGSPIAKRILLKTSTDHGRTWDRARVVASANISSCVIQPNSTGNPQALLLRGNPETIVLLVDPNVCEGWMTASTDDGMSFSPLRNVSGQVKTPETAAQYAGKFGRIGGVPIGWFWGPTGGNGLQLPSGRALACVTEESPRKMVTLSRFVCCPSR